MIRDTLVENRTYGKRRTLQIHGGSYVFGQLHSSCHLSCEFSFFDIVRVGSGDPETLLSFTVWN